MFARYFQMVGYCVSIWRRDRKQCDRLFVESEWSVYRCLLYYSLNFSLIFENVQNKKVKADYMLLGVELEVCFQS